MSTQNVGHCEECVEGESHGKPQHHEGDVLRCEGGEQARDECEDVGGHDGGDPSVSVSKPAEDHHAWYGPTEEERLGESRHPGPVTHPVLLHSDGDMVALHAVLPPGLARHHLPGSRGADGVPRLHLLQHQGPVSAVLLALAVSA